MNRNIYPAEGYARITMNVFREDSYNIGSLKGDMWLTFAAQSIIMFKRLVGLVRTTWLVLTEQRYYGQAEVQKYRHWKNIMNGIILIASKKWERDEVQPEGALERLVYSMRKSMLVRSNESDLFSN